MDQPEILHKVGLEELLEWAQSPTTRKVREFLQECKQSLEEQLSRGVTLVLNNSDQTALQTAKVVGMVQGQDLILSALQDVEDYYLDSKEATDDNA